MNKDYLLMAIQSKVPNSIYQLYSDQVPYYIDELMLQISATIKPKHCITEINVSKSDLNTLLSIQDDNFLSFNSDSNYYLYERYDGSIEKREITDDTMEYIGENQLMFFKEGKYYVSYNAKWFDSYANLDADAKINCPDDILICIPSYVASQMFKFEDEYKAQIFRNEFEILFARINDVHYNSMKSISIRGDW